MKPVKWIKLSFYRERKQRKLARALKREQIAVAQELWEQSLISTPEDWERSLDNFFNIFSHQGKKLHVRLIPKCYYSSLRRLFTHLHYHNNKKTMKKIQMQKTTNELYTLLMDLSPKSELSSFFHKNDRPYSVSFVRNPYHRLVSCYRNKIASHDYMGHKQENRIQRDLAEEAKYSFESFVHFVSKQPNHLRNPHYASQWLQLTPGLTTYSFIGYCEYFSKHAHLLFSTLNAPNDLLEKLDIRVNHSGPYNWKDYYNNELAQKVYQAFWPDFEAFGYHQDSWKKDFEQPFKEPIRNYNPTQDIERFRNWFPSQA